MRRKGGEREGGRGGGAGTDPTGAPPGEHDHGDSSGGEAVSVRGEDGGVGGGVRAEGREVGGREAVRRRVAGADGGVLGVDGGDPVRLDLVTAVVTPSPGRLRGL